MYTAPGEEHWHGGTADNLMCHLAMLEGTESGDGTTWLEPVTDEQYAAANQSRPRSASLLHATRPGPKGN